MLASLVVPVLSLSAGGTFTVGSSVVKTLLKNWFSMPAIFLLSEVSVLSSLVMGPMTDLDCVLLFRYE